MANASVSSNSSGGDVLGSTIRVSFKGPSGARAPAARLINKLTLSCGAAASSALINICYVTPKSDEQAFNIALQARGPQAALKLLMRANVAIVDADGFTTAPKLVGFIVNRHHIFYEGGAFDQLNATVLDDKWAMSKHRMFGRYEYDPSYPPIGAYFNQAGKCIFNRNGFRNCMDTPEGPRFSAIENFGYNGKFNSEIYEEPAPGSATVYPRSWRTIDVAAYIFGTMFHSRGALIPGARFDLGLQQIGDYIEVPEGIENVLTDRPIRDVDYDGWDVLAALQDICVRAGAFEIAVRPAPNAGTSFNSQVQIINLDPASFNEIHLPEYVDPSTVAGAMADKAMVCAGSLVEDVAPSYRAIVNQGDAPAAEQMASTMNAGAEATDGVGSGVLDFAWDQGEENEFTAYMDRDDGRGGSKFSRDRFISACQQYARPFCAYKIRDNINFFNGTKYALVRVGSRNPVLMATQLTADNTGNGPSGWQPRPIIAEYRMTIDEYAAYKAQTPAPVDPTPWVPFLSADGLTLSPDGKTVYFPAAREQGYTWFSPPDPDEAGEGAEDADDPKDNTFSSNMKRRQIRLNLAPCGDFNASCIDRSDPNKVIQRLDPDAPEFALQVRQGPLAFVDWLRTGASAPNGLGRIDSNVAGFAERASAGNELYSDFRGPAGAPFDTSRAAKMAAAKIRDVNRVLLNGTLEFIGLNPALVPGYAMKMAGDVMNGLDGVAKAVTYDADLQRTLVVMGSSEISPLFALRGISMPHGGSHTLGPTGPPPPGKKKDDYDYGSDASGKKIQPPADAGSKVGGEAARRQKGGRVGDFGGLGFGAAGDGMGGEAGQRTKGPGIGNDGLGFGRPSDGMGGAAGQRTKGKGVGADGFGFGAGPDGGKRNKGNGWMTPGGPGGSHQEWTLGKENDTSGQVPKGTRLWDSRNGPGNGNNTSGKLPSGGKFWDGRNQNQLAAADVKAGKPAIGEGAAARRQRYTKESAVDSKRRRDDPGNNLDE